MAGGRCGRGFGDVKLVADFRETTIGRVKIGDQGREVGEEKVEHEGVRASQFDTPNVR